MPRGVKGDGPETRGGRGGRGRGGGAAPGVARGALKRRGDRDGKEGQKSPAGVAGAAEGGPATGANGGGVDLVELEKKRKELADQLQKCEVQIHRLETQYFDNANPQGNALRGYEGLLSVAAASSAQRAAFRPEDRIFSGSSASWAGNVGGG